MTATRTPHDRLRACWQALRAVPADADRRELFPRLNAEHRAALDALAAAQALDPAVAGAVQAAFTGAAEHVERSTGIMTCYIGIDGRLYSTATSVLGRSAALAEMAASQSLDPETVAQARAALERDIAYLAERAAAGASNAPYPVEATPESVQAAAFLAGLFSGN